MAPRKSKTHNPLLWIRGHKIISLLLFIVLPVAGFFVYEKVALELNKRAFVHARAAIDTVYADIVAQVGPPDNSKRVIECSTSHVTFGQGPISCSVDTDFIYGVSDEGEAVALFRKIQAVISKNKQFKPTKALSLTITDQTVVNSAYHTASDEFSLDGLQCIVNYVFDTPREIFLTINDNSKKPLQVVIGCHGITRAMYYPNNQ